MHAGRDNERVSVYQRITNEIVAELERGVLPWRKPWTDANLEGRVLRPLRANGEPYRGINVILLWIASVARGFISPFWMTYRQAPALGGQVRKGEQGSPVIFASTLVKEDQSPDGTMDPVTVSYAKAYTVFNAEQVDGLADQFIVRPAVERMTPMLRDAGAEQFIAATAADIRHGGLSGLLRSGPEYIQMPPLELFDDAVAYYATLGHELIHWTSHKTRLNRSTAIALLGEAAYEMEELIAEFGAAFLCADLELAQQLRRQHASYIHGWLNLLKSDDRAVFRAAAFAQRACEYLHSKAKP